MKLIESFARLVVVQFYKLTGQLGSLCDRALICHIGFSGNVSEIDKGIAKDRNLRPLNRFEMWLLSPTIETEKALRKNAWRDAVIEVTGEDPFEDSWGFDPYDFQGEAV